MPKRCHLARRTPVTMTKVGYREVKRILRKAGLGEKEARPQWLRLIDAGSGTRER